MFCYKGLGPSYPMLKIALGGNFEMGSRSYLFLRIKLPKCTKFHVGIPKCMILANFSIKSPDYYQNKGVGQTRIGIFSIVA